MANRIHLSFLDELSKIAQMGAMNPNVKKMPAPKVPKPFKAKAVKQPPVPEVPNAVPGVASGPVGGTMPGY